MWCADGETIAMSGLSRPRHFQAHEPLVHIVIIPDVVPCSNRDMSVARRDQDATCICPIENQQAARHKTYPCLPGLAIPTPV